MKANNNQKIVINELIQHINTWTTTNDINSPSHWSLNDEWDCGLNLELENNLKNQNIIIPIAEKLNELLSEIRKIK